MASSTVSGLAASWMPMNWVDWLIVAAACTGLLGGARRGLILALGGLVAAVLAVAAAAHLTPVVAAAANAHWHADRQVSAFLQRYMPLPDGSGQIPYSPSALQLFLQQATSQGAIAPAYASALAALVGHSGPAAGNPTIGTYVDDALAARIVDFAAFTTALIVGEAVLLGIVHILLGGVARRGMAGLLNGVLGAAVGLMERLVEVTAGLIMLASLSVLPAFGAIAGALSHSRWAPLLLSAFRRVVPTADPLIQSWLSWL